MTKPTSPELLARMREAKADGWPTKELVATFGVSHGVVYSKLGGGGMSNEEVASFNLVCRAIVAQCKYPDLRGL